MIVSLLAAMDERRGIGVNNRLAWHLPADMRRFKALTMGHHLIVGRKTWESIGKSLPGRTMIVLSRQGGAQFAGSLSQALRLAESRGETEVFVIGGGEIFDQALPQANRMYLTLVHAITQADVFFPNYRAQEWRVIASERHEADENNTFAMTFLVLERDNGGGD
jgi:dihydrofolate reductase